VSTCTDVLLNELVELGAEPGGRDVGGRDEDDVRGREAAIVSSLKAAATVIVHEGRVWELAVDG
jgi:hypothetical protein